MTAFAQLHVASQPSNSFNNVPLPSSEGTVEAATDGSLVAADKDANGKLGTPSAKVWGNLQEYLCTCTHVKVVLLICYMICCANYKVMGMFLITMLILYKYYYSGPFLIHVLS